MFDIAFSELLLVAVISLIVMGPNRIPETVRTLSLWVGRIRQVISSAKRELENEVGIEEIKEQLHNEEIMRNINETKEDVNKELKQIQMSNQKRTDL
ncbi:MAG: twin-arginine translocase subunit TatB [Cellvibrionales bacterium TMED49]|nr:MAG: twin-arginine translocase subunit TatB [Cellvibrionales bacterium TMED49]|tara:strand:+ start:564 stop:854 length:291 start_codon:yes stop_codon:yes gene_type:complete